MREYNTAESYSWKVLAAMVVNVITTVGVVLTNKYLVSVAGFPYMVTLSGIHFLFTGVGCYIMMQLGYFQYKEASFLGVLPVATGSCLSVGFMNLNLAKNTVGFYQITKLLCIPVTIVMEYLMFSTKASCIMVLSLMVLLLGVGIATVSDVGLNFVGSIYAGFAILATVMGQIFTKSKQKALKLDAMQLLYHASPIVTSGMVVLSPFFDEVIPTENDHSLYTYLTTGQLNGVVVSIILLTCAFAFGVNVSNYLVIGQTSPITYQVVGHAKTVLVLMFGWLYFDKETNMKNVFGVGVAVLGMIWYSYIKQQDSDKAEKEKEKTKTDVVEVTTKN